MIFLLNTVIKASAILALALVAARLLRKQSAAVRHCVLTAGIISAALTPGLSLLVPSWDLKFPVLPALSDTAEPQGPIAVESDFSPAFKFAPAITSELPAPARAATTPETHTPAESQDHPLPTVPRHAITVRTILQSSWLPPGAAFTWIAGILLTFGILLVGSLRLAWIAFRAQTLTSGPWVSSAHEIALRYEQLGSD